MAKQKTTPLDAPGVLAPVPDMPTIRSTMWQRHPAHTADEVVHDYPLQLPRFLSKDGEAEQKYVTTPEACDDALNDGWVVHPGDPVR